MTTASHRVAVWNPAYATDSLEAHQCLLLGWGVRAGATTHDDEANDVHVWWGKVKSGKQQPPMPHLDDVPAVKYAANDDAEVHLYLTDFGSLYVVRHVSCVMRYVLPDVQRVEIGDHTRILANALPRMLI